MQDAIIPEKMRILKGSTNRKRWVLSLSTPCQLLLIKMAALNGNILLNVIEYVQYSMVGNFLFFENGLWTEAANTNTLLENNLLTLTRDLSSFQHLFWKRKINILILAKKFGETCISPYHINSHQAKLANQSTRGIWVGFTEGHPFGTYHVFNQKQEKLD